MTSGCSASTNHCRCECHVMLLSNDVGFTVLKIIKVTDSQRHGTTAEHHLSTHPKLQGFPSKFCVWWMITTPPFTLRETCSRQICAFVMLCQLCVRSPVSSITKHLRTWVWCALENKEGLLKNIPLDTYICMHLSVFHSTVCYWWNEMGSEHSLVKATSITFSAVLNWTSVLDVAISPQITSGSGDWQLPPSHGGIITLLWGNHKQNSVIHFLLASMAYFLEKNLNGQLQNILQVHFL